MMGEGRRSVSSGGTWHVYSGRLLFHIIIVYYIVYIVIYGKSQTMVLKQINHISCLQLVHECNAKSYMLRSQRVVACAIVAVNICLSRLTLIIIHGICGMRAILHSMVNLNQAYKI